MTQLSAKIFEILRNLKSDAVPRPPRPETTSENGEVPEQNNENVNSSTDYEEVIIDSENMKDDFKKAKSKIPFFIPKKKKNKPLNNDDDYCASSTVNTQANAPVINIVNSNKVHCGDTITYYTGPVNKAQDETTEQEEFIEKSNIIVLLLEADIKADFTYLDYISKNLGKNWHSFFKRLGFKKGRIETVEYDELKNGVSEVRYKLLLEWIRNFENTSLGHLATTLWDVGEREMIGPEKGMAHLAVAAILNSLWDLWAGLENKPLWRLLIDMEPEELVSTIDFRYIKDVLTKEEAVQMLRAKKAGREQRIKTLMEKGYPAYTTQVGQFTDFLFAQIVIFSILKNQQ